VKALLVSTVGFIIFLLVFSLWGFYQATHPGKLVSTITPADLLIPYEKINFTTTDNITIQGWWIPSLNPDAKTIILLHGYPADKGNILSAMSFLHTNYNLLLFDFRYFGQSSGTYTTAGKNEVLDLQAAVKFLQTKGINEVGIWGFSLGGAVAFLAAPTLPQIKAIVAESPYARLDWMVTEYYSIPILKYPLSTLTRIWGRLFLNYDLLDISPAKSAAKLTIPILIIHSRDDDVISFRHAQVFQEKLKHNPNASFIFVDEGKHGAFIPNHQEIIENFFAKNLT